MLDITSVNILIGASLVVSFSFVVILLLQRSKRIGLQQQHEKERIENTRQQDFLNAIIRAQEQERNRIATDLHDSVGSELAMLKFNLSRFASDLAKKKIDNKYLLEELDHLDQSIDHFTHICRDLYPLTLKNYGFITTFEELVSKLNKRTGLDCRYRFNLKESDLFLDIESKVNLFRLFQEVLNNLTKYGGCTVLDIGFMKYPNAIKIILKHNGVPFDNDEVAQMMKQGKGVGLISIYNRLYLMNGIITYATVSNGSEILIELPLPDEKN
jgi:signal transduction histidine kinase